MRGFKTNRFVFILSMALLLSACGGTEPVPPTPTPPSPAKDTQAPAISVKASQVNVIAGTVATLGSGELKLGDTQVATWSDNVSKTCQAALSFTPTGGSATSIASGTKLSEAGMLKLTVTDEAGNAGSSEISLTAVAVYGLEALSGLELQVDKESDLLAGLTVADGLTLTKVEIEQDGTRTEIPAPYRYTAEFPGTITLLLTLTKPSGGAVEVTAEGLAIKALEYIVIALETADIIQEKYPRYNNLQQTTKDFIYPHLLASYAACNHSKQSNRVHIIMGESCNIDDIENIGRTDLPSNHAYEGYYRIRALTDAPIKGCHDSWSNLEAYIDKHPNDFFMISCAADAGGGDNIDELNNNPHAQPLRNILKKKNIILICSGCNRTPNSRKLYNENSKNGNFYASTSINSELNNKIAAIAYHSRGDNYFSPAYREYGGLRSALPVGFEKDKGNIVMPMTPLIRSSNTEDQISDSSYPTAVLAATTGNAISIIMSNHPGITPEEAMTIIINNYFTEETFQYKDETTNRELADGGKWYFINMQKLLQNELVQSDKIEKIQFNADITELPSGRGLCYVGMGIQFEYGGEWYNMTKENEDKFRTIVANNDIKWRWNKTSWRKYGGAGTATFDVYVLDKQGDKIPDLHQSHSKSIL